MHSYVLGDRTEVPEAFADYFDPMKTAIVEIDMHRGHLDPDATCPGPRGRAIVEPINKFNQQARELKIPVIHIKMTLRKGYIDDPGVSAWRRMMLMNPDWKNPDQARDHAIEGSKSNEFVVGVNPEDYVVDTKKRLSCFYCTDLEFLLRRLGKEIVVITGIFSDACDLSTAYDAADRDFKVVVPRDLQRGYSREMEEAAYKIVSLYLGLVVDSHELVEEWKKKSIRK